MADQHVALIERKVIDISIEAGGIPPAREPGIRHLLAGPHDETALGGYRKSPGDVVDWPIGSYFDPQTRDCPACLASATQA